jgi:hypothetical protein
LQLFKNPGSAKYEIKTNARGNCTGYDVDGDDSNQSSGECNMEPQPEQQRLEYRHKLDTPTVPNGPSDTATFGVSNTTDVSLSSGAQVSSIVFNAGASPLTITSYPAYLQITGGGITNNSATTQNFIASPGSPLAEISFANNATAGSFTAFTAIGSDSDVFPNSLGGRIDFSGTASAGNASFTNNSGTFAGCGSGPEGGATRFFNSSTAGSATFLNNGTAVCGSQGGSTDFYDNSTAANATFAINGSSSGGPGYMSFQGNATAGNAHFTLNGAEVSGEFGGEIGFYDSASATNGIFIINGGMTGGASGGWVSFVSNSTAANGTFTINGGTAAGAYGGLVDTYSPAGNNASFTANGGTVVGAYGGEMIFKSGSTASNASLTANGGAGGGGSILFWGDPAGGTAQVYVFSNGNLDISGHNAPGITIGSIEGDGNVFLGSNNLTVGANNVSTIFSGVIQDGGKFGGTCGWLAKIGSGILTFQGRATHDYIADTVSLSLVSGSIIHLNFSGTADTIRSLTVNGVVQVPGLYGGPDSGAPHQLPEFAGTGTVQVTRTPCQTDQAGVARAIIRGVSAATTFEERRGSALTEAEIESVPILVPPTRSTFMATWASVSGAASYHLDVSTSSGFGSYVYGYQDLDVGHITSRIVSGLTPGTTYHYRVRAYNSHGVLSNSAVKTVTTAGGLGLVINPTFDSSITGDPNAAAIEAMINRAISIYESLFNDPITVSILFRYSTRLANGCTPLPPGALARSETGPALNDTMPWDTFVAALRADATTVNDAIAISSLPQTPLSSNVWALTANGRAVGLNTPPRMCEDGCVHDGCPYDGIITPNSAAPFKFTRPPSPDQYDAQEATEHEIDEVLGLGSFLDFGLGDLDPQDLFSWSSFGTRNLTTSGSRYFSIDSGQTNIVNFNQDPNGDFGDWLSEACPQTHPYVQNAFSCPGQFADISAFSPEGINLDIIGYDLSGPTPTPTPTPIPILPPAVATNPATNVASFSATLNGSLNPRGSTTTVDFQYGLTTSYGFTTPAQTQTGNILRNISANITGLMASHVYHFRIVAHNNGGTSFGSDRTFTTLSATGAPVVTTSPATLIASFSATLNGSLDPHGLTTSVSFQYGTTPSYGSTTPMQSHTGNTYLNVSANITGLMASHLYHFRIVATNSAGTTFGGDRTFTTLSATGPPVVTTNPATFIASFSATLNGLLDSHGLTTSVHFQYGPTTSYGLTTAPQSHTGNTYLNISANISSLSASTIYHFRILASNSAGTSLGSDSTITTLSATGASLVTTHPETNVTISSATLNGLLDSHGLTTSVYFQYGTTTSYGSTTSMQSQTGDTYRNITGNISSLTTHTTYHFRIVATNSAGTRIGSDRTFTMP